MRIIRTYDVVEVTTEEAAQAIAEWVNRKRVDNDLKPVAFREDARMSDGTPVPILYFVRNPDKPYDVRGFSLQLDRPSVEGE